MATFADEKYTPQLYIRSSMDGDSEENVRSATRILTAVRDKSVAELRRSVYKNSSDFLAVADHIVAFEEGLGQMHSTVFQLRSAVNALIGAASLSSIISIDESSSVQGGSAGPPASGLLHRRPSRESLASSSMASQEGEQRHEPPPVDHAKRRQKMAMLGESIAGFDQFANPSRFLLLEGGGIREKAIGPSGNGEKAVNMYLFNDALAITSKRPPSSSAKEDGTDKKRMAVLRFWLLSDCSIIDIPQSPAFTNAFKVISAADGSVVTLETETDAGKRLWMQHIIRTKANPPPAAPLPAASPTDGSQAQRGDAARSHSRSASSISGTFSKFSRHSHTDSAGLLSSEVGGMASGEAPPGAVSSEKVSALTALLDRLSEETSMCSYDAAIDLVDKVKYEIGQLDSHSLPILLLSTRLQGLVDRLAFYMYEEIGNLIISKSTMASHIQRLTLLGRVDDAREKFLAARSDFIRDRTRHLRYVGDIAKTVNDIGFVTFTSIAASLDWYRGAFKETAMAAGFVSWTKMEICTFATTIIKQVLVPGAGSNGRIDLALLGMCLSIARSHCANLSVAGLDLVFYLDDLLLPHVNAAIVDHQRGLEVQLEAAVDADSFQPDSLQAAYKDVQISKITTCMVTFKRLLEAFVADLEPLMKEELCDVLVRRLTEFYENFCTLLLHVTYDEAISSLAFLAVINNVMHVAGAMLPATIATMRARFPRSSSDLHKLKDRLDAMAKSMIDIFACTTAKSIVPASLDCYTATGMLEEDATISDWIVTVLPLLGKIGRECPQGGREDLLAKVFLKVFQEIRQRVLPQSLTGEEPRLDEGLAFGQRGLEQLLLDAHFLLAASAPFPSEECAKVALDVCSRAVDTFKARRPLIVLRQDVSWYDERAQAALSIYPIDFGLT